MPLTNKCPAFRVWIGPNSPNVTARFVVRPYPMPAALTASTSSTKMVLTRFRWGPSRPAMSFTHSTKWWGALPERATLERLEIELLFAENDQGTEANCEEEAGAQGAT